MAGPDGVRAGAGGPITATQAAPGDALPTQARDVRAPVTPSTDRGVTVRTQRGDTLDSVRREALGQMADAAGLGAAARAEFIERALKLDGGTLNVPAATPLAQARALSASDAQRAIERGTVVVAPTLAQAGLLKLTQSREADPSVPAGAAVGLVLPQAQNRLPVVPGRAGVIPEVAQSILGNVAQGRPPFNPDLGQVGRVSW
ncbi:MAG TPA: hypothetical protein VLJ62_19020, partial [Burkholderiaceae bacterium]|nr:hypothetical protein [Burkholderiaceae bacterium]